MVDAYIRFLKEMPFNQGIAQAPDMDPTVEQSKFIEILLVAQSRTQPVPPGGTTWRFSAHCTEVKALDTHEFYADLRPYRATQLQGWGCNRHILPKHRRSFAALAIARSASGYTLLG